MPDDREAMLKARAELANVPDDRLLAKLTAAVRRPMTRAEMEEQRRSYVRAEAGFGSDVDEAAYAAAVARGDAVEIARLNREAEARMAAVDRYFGEKPDA